MLREICLPSQSPPLSFQVEAYQVASSQDVASWGRIRILWQGLGFVVLMLSGVSACALVSFVSHGSAKPSRLAPEVAFSPSLPALEPRIGHSRPWKDSHPSVLPGVRQQRFSLRSSRSDSLQPSQDLPLQLKRVSDHSYNQDRTYNLLTAIVGSPNIPRFPGDVRTKSQFHRLVIQGPRTESQFHRFVSQDASASKAAGLDYFTRQRFIGTRREGVYNGTFRLQFNLPGKDNSPKAIELVPLSKGEPTFAAVKLRLNFGATIKNLPPDYFMQVVDVAKGGHAEESGIMKGDLIRAVSMPDVEEQRYGLSQLWQSTAKSFWLWPSQLWNTFGVPVPIGSIPAPDSEESMVILDRIILDKGYFAALNEHSRLNGDNAEVVILVERPSAPAAESAEQQH